MTFLPSLPRLSSPTAPRLTSVTRHSVRPAWWLPFVVTTFAGLAAFALAGRDAGEFEPRLALLLRFMAALKAVAVLAALGLTCWRLRTPIATPMRLGYLAALASMAAAPGLIWSLAHIALGAACFHAGLFGFLVCALRDDGIARVLRRPGG